MERFGANPLEVLEQEPERLGEIKTGYVESRVMRKLLLLLAPLKVTPNTALKVLDHFGMRGVELLRESLFQLCEVPGFGFHRVDEIVRKSNGNLHDPMRIQVPRCAWNSRASIGCRYSTFWRKPCWVVLAHPKYTKPQKGNKTDRKDAKWICDLIMCDMIKPSFIPPPDIRELRDLMRYRVKLTNMLTSEKNRALNCLTVSNLKLDDVFSDVFGKSSRSIIQHILAHPGETFDVAPFVDRRCKHPIEEIQAAVDGAISREQAAKLKECLRHMDELNAHRENIEKKSYVWLTCTPCSWI